MTPSHHQLLEFTERLAKMPLATEDLTSTWTWPDWEEVVEWWDDKVKEARALTGKTYR